MALVVVLLDIYQLMPTTHMQLGNYYELLMALSLSLDNPHQRQKHIFLLSVSLPLSARQALINLLHLLQTNTSDMPKCGHFKTLHQLPQPSFSGLPLSLTPSSLEQNHHGRSLYRCQYNLILLHCSTEILSSRPDLPVLKYMSVD